MANNEMLLKKLEATILARLEVCDGESMPYVCDMAKTEEGKGIVIAFVVDLVAQGKFRIIDALMEKERSLNPNMIQD